MIKVVRGDDSFTAWKLAVGHLLSRPGTEEDSLLLQIDNPTRWNSDWFSRIDPRKVRGRGENPNDVANTLFPLKTFTNSTSRGELYKRYMRAHRMGGTKSWGTYFRRMISFGKSETNQLERAIDVLNAWEKNPGTAIVFHLSSCETDRPRPIGGPCLQLLQLQVKVGRIDMTAVYRNHDYFNKAFPNLIGVGRLLTFICAETGRVPGSLVCHSGHAYSSSGKAALAELLARA